jgi:hypothetical protein
MAVVAGGLVAMGAASQARATFFSFASDDNPSTFTFVGTAGSNSGDFLIADAGRPNTYTLLIDDNNGPLPAIPIAVELHASLTASAGQSLNIGGGRYLHTYDVTGTFGFYDAQGNALLTATVGPNAGTLIVPGTQTAWSTTGAVLGADSYADVTYTVSQALVDMLGGEAAAGQYGIVVGSSGPNSNDDFGFDLTVINTVQGGLGVAIDVETKAPTSAWESESSFSGSTSVPTPAVGAGMLLGGGMLAARRRR